MSSHINHPDTHTHGLADDCPRCAEHAKHPFMSLDDNNLRALILRTRAWMRDEKFPRSITENKAMRNVETVLRALLRIEMLAQGDER